MSAVVATLSRRSPAGEQTKLFQVALQEGGLMFLGLAVAPIGNRIEVRIVGASMPIILQQDDKLEVSFSTARGL